MNHINFNVAVDRVGRALLTKQNLTYSPGWEQTYPNAHDKAVELVLALSALGVINVTDIPSFAPEI